jgi:hypothetical protein
MKDERKQLTGMDRIDRIRKAKTEFMQQCFCLSSAFSSYPVYPVHPVNFCFE